MKWWRLATAWAVTDLNGIAAGKAPKLELGVTRVKAGWGQLERGGMKVKTRAQGIDESCSLSSFTMMRHDGGGNRGKKRERERRRGRWACVAEPPEITHLQRRSSFTRH